MVVELLKKNVEELLQNTDYQLVSVELEDDTLVVSIDRLEGVDMDFCADLNSRLRALDLPQLDDYQLEVGSVSITAPFATLLQYQKHIGEQVEVLKKDRQIIRGTLLRADEQDFTVAYEKMERLEGKKKKQKVQIEDTLSYDTVQYVKLMLKI